MDDLSHLHPHGLFLRREALRFGYDDRDLPSTWVFTGSLVRVRQGTCVTGPDPGGPPTPSTTTCSQGAGRRADPRATGSHSATPPAPWRSGLRALGSRT